MQRMLSSRELHFRHTGDLTLGLSVNVCKGPFARPLPEKPGVEGDTRNVSPAGQERFRPCRQAYKLISE